MWYLRRWCRTSQPWRTTALRNEYCLLVGPICGEIRRYDGNTAPSSRNYWKLENLPQKGNYELRKGKWCPLLYLLFPWRRLRGRVFDCGQGRNQSTPRYLLLFLWSSTVDWPIAAIDELWSTTNEARPKPKITFMIVTKRWDYFHYLWFTSAILLAITLSSSHRGKHECHLTRVTTTSNPEKIIRIIALRGLSSTLPLRTPEFKTSICRVTKPFREVSWTVFFFGFIAETDFFPKLSIAFQPLYHPARRYIWIWFKQVRFIICILFLLSTDISQIATLVLLSLPHLC